MAQNTDTQVRANCFGSRLVVGVVGGGVHSFFLRVMVGTCIHTQPSASLHTPPVYVDYIIILSYRLRRVSVLWSAPSSSRYRGANSGFGTLLESLSRCQPVLESLVVDVVGGGVQSFFLRVMVGTGIHTQPSASLHTPPVYIDYIIILSYRLRRVSVLWSAPSSSRNRGSNRGFSRLGWSAEPTLLSVLWYKPGVRLPPRVANMVQTPGETLVGKPVDVSVSIR